MSEVTQIQTIKSNTLALIEELHTSPKPSYQIDGQSVNWESYLRSLEQTVDWCDRKLAAAQPFEEETQAYS